MTEKIRQRNNLVRTLRESGHTLNGIANISGYSKSRVCKILTGGVSRSKHKQARAKHLYKMGYGVPAICKIVGYKPTSVYKIIKGISFGSISAKELSLRLNISEHRAIGYCRKHGKGTGLSWYFPKSQIRYLMKDLDDQFREEFGQLEYIFPYSDVSITEKEMGMPDISEDVVFYKEPLVA